jgi:cell division protein FtsB
MATRQRRKSIIGPFIVPLIAIGFSAYFAWHAWHGSFGVEARRELDVTADALRAQLAELQTEKATIERRVKLLRPQSLESDMLDERGRAILGYAQANEVAIYPNAPASATVAPAPAAMPIALVKPVISKPVNSHKITQNELNKQSREVSDD